MVFVEVVAGVAGAVDLFERNGHHVDLLAGIQRKRIVLHRSDRRPRAAEVAQGGNRDSIQAQCPVPCPRRRT